MFRQLFQLLFLSFLSQAKETMQILPRKQPLGTSHLPWQPVEIVVHIPNEKGGLKNISLHPDALTIERKYDPELYFYSAGNLKKYRAGRRYPRINLQHASPGVKFRTFPIPKQIPTAYRRDTLPVALKLPTKPRLEPTGGKHTLPGRNVPFRPKIYQPKLHKHTTQPRNLKKTFYNDDMNTPNSFTSKYRPVFRQKKEPNSPNIQKNTVPFFWDGQSPMNITITQKDNQNQTIFSYTFDPKTLLPKSHITNNTTPVSFPISLENYTRTVNAMKGPQKINLLDDNSLEISGIRDNKNKLSTFYSAFGQNILPQIKNGVVLSTVEEDQEGNFIYEDINLDNKKNAKEKQNNKIFMKSLNPEDEKHFNGSRLVLMQVRKPDQDQDQDFKTKIEPLIVTSIYRQFLADLKKNKTPKSGKHKLLRFSFKLGPGYFNNTNIKTKNY